MEEKSAHKKLGLFIKTYGCQMNEYDTLKLQKILEKDYASVETPEEADLVLINTCSVREKPEQKLYSLLGRLSEVKERKPGLMVGVCGCVAQQEGENIVKRSKTVDLVFGTHNLSLVPSLLERRASGLPPQVAIDYREDWEELPIGYPEVEKVSTFVSISRGCNKNCTYCIVPTTRGKEVSRPIDEIEREVKIAAHRGVKEITLLGQTVNSYGLDFSPKITFAQLLERVSTVSGIERIRFTSPHPQEIRKDFIDLVTTNPKICRHVHMPLQSGSNRILKLMNRNYKREKYLKIISDLRERIPAIGLTTDIIVGFPGETREDFEDTLSLIKEVQFDNIYSYIFSKRPGTVAEGMEEDLTKEEKLERLQELQAVQKEITAKRLASWIGKKCEVLVESKSPYQPDGATQWQGRNSENLIVNFTDHAFRDVGRVLKPGAFVTVEIVDSSNFSLKGAVRGVRDSSGEGAIEFVDVEATPLI